MLTVAVLVAFEVAVGAPLSLQLAVNVPVVVGYVKVILVLLTVVVPAALLTVQLNEPVKSL